MDGYEFWNINGTEVEYYDNDHIYLADGVIKPSITQILKYRFGGMYSNIDSETLKKASQKGTAVHKAIEDYCKHGEESDLRELHNFKFLQKQYGFEVVRNEVPVILFGKDNSILSVGRLDMVIEMDGELGLADIKRVSTLNKEYLGFQLNMYRIAYEQTYDDDISFLKGIHLKSDMDEFGKYKTDIRKFVDIPINEEMTWDLINEYYERSEKDE